MNEKIQFHWPILGHTQIKKYLQSSIVDNKLAHAYLFYGPTQIGKFLTAKYFSNSIICNAQNEKKPCQKCNSCLQFQKKIHADVNIINPAEDKKNIIIEQIRELQHKLSLRSFLTKYKIAIIDDAWSMTEEASNALLKTLEEPTPKTIFILIAQNKDQLLSTIISRCQSLEFKSVPNFKIINWLISKNPDQKNINTITSLSTGRPGRAISFISDPESINQHLEKLNTITQLITGNYNSRFEIINKFLNNKLNNQQEIISLLDSWQSFFRDLYLLKTSNTSYLTNLPFKNKIQILSKHYTYLQLAVILNKINLTKKFISQSINPRLVLENFVLTI